eukprot:COSAG06_NODE_1620_length_8905_cov_255.644788_9_plen_87_part_00
MRLRPPPASVLARRFCTATPAREVRDGAAQLKASGLRGIYIRVHPGLSDGFREGLQLGERAATIHSKINNDVARWRVGRQRAALDS